MLCGGELGMVVENSEDGIYTGMKVALVQPQLFNSYSAKLETYRMPFDLKNAVDGITKVLDEL